MPTPADADDPIAAAQRLGIEADAEATRQWMLAVDASDHGIGVDTATGTFGDRVAMLDFDPADLGRFRRLVPHVRLDPVPRSNRRSLRVADELEAAAYVRELFDEPSACLYQVPGLLEAAEVRAASAAMVIEFFRERLLGYDRVRELVEELAGP